jgi:hypothetical protein
MNGMSCEDIKVAIASAQPFFHLCHGYSEPLRFIHYQVFEVNGIGFRVSGMEGKR